MHYQEKDTAFQLGSLGKKATNQVPLFCTYYKASHFFSARCFCSHWEATSTLRPEEVRQALVKHLKQRRPTSKEWPLTISVPLSLSISTQSARLARSPTGELRPWNIDGPFLGVNGTLCVLFPGVSLCVLDFFFFFSNGTQLSVWLCELSGHAVTHQRWITLNSIHFYSNSAAL